MVVLRVMMMRRKGEVMSILRSWSPSGGRKRKRVVGSKGSRHAPR